MSAKPKAVVLLSGGLDSATTLAIAREQGCILHSLAFDYGQRHRIELRQSAILAREFGAQHLEVKIDSGLFRGTALVGDSIAVPDFQEHRSEIPLTYVPARNILFLAHALSLAESIGALAIYIGVNALDYSGYPDCRPQFIEAFEKMLQLGTRSGDAGQAIAIEAPLIQMTKAEIIQTGIKLGVDYALTNSCYNPGSDGEPCQRCDSCELRSRGFAQAGVADPLLKKYKKT